MSRAIPPLPFVVLLFLAALVSILAGCGGSDKRLDKDEIRRNADDADRDLDRESSKYKDQ